jgi:hypothetical protein
MRDRPANRSAPRAVHSDRDAAPVLTGLAHLKAQKRIAQLESKLVGNTGADGSMPLFPADPAQYEPPGLVCPVGRW